MKRLNLSALLLAFSLLGSAMSAASADLAPTHLRCEYQINPIAIDTPRPRLSWWLESEQRDERQTAYQVVVASSPENLRAGRFDLWDSGRVTSDQSVHVEYAGQPLVSRQRCHWQVRVWNRAGKASAWSRPTSWAMGLLEPADWQGQWIAATDRRAIPRLPRVAGYHSAEAKTADETKWVQVDLGTERELDEVRLHPPGPSGFEHVAGFGFPVRFRLEVSNDPQFHEGDVLADFTQADYPSPGNKAVSLSGQGRRARHVRVTATRLWNRGTGPAPHGFGLAELEVFSGGTNVALHAPVLALDSVEDYGWGCAKLTDGVRLTDPDEADPAGPGHAAVLLRKGFLVKGKVARATAHLCGLGYSELEINGRKIGDHVLDPGFTDYSRHAQYLTYDVTSAIRRGENTVGVGLGGGWYDLATPDLFGFERAPWSASPRLRCQLHIEYEDGTTEIVASDPSWKWSTGAITFNGVRGGETIDARQERRGWSRPSFDDTDWASAVVVPGPAGRLVAQQHPPIRVTDSIRPIRVTQPKPGVYVFDLGVNIAGWARLTTQGRRGTRITLEYNERLNRDGTLDTQHLTSHTRGRFQKDEFVLKGRGLERFEPRFTYHGFRYVQVTGLTEKPTLHTLTGRWVTTDPEVAGHFACSNPRLNLLQQVFVRTYLNNLHGLPTDCPQREKMGWLNDGCVDMEMAFYNFDTPILYRKWLQDMIDAQDANGHVPDFVPTCGWGRSKPDGSPGEMADPWWGGAIVLAPWKLYQHYGDRRVFEEAFPAMKAYVDYLTSTAQDHVIAWGLGDWLDESAGGGGRRVPVAQTSTAAYAHFATILSQAASLLGREQDARDYGRLAEAVGETFNANYLEEGSGFYAVDSQTAQALPLALGLVPKDKRGLVVDRLADNISRWRRHHVSTGIVGALYLFHTLMEHGRDDLAWAMVTREQYPGWLHMLNQGATSIWEAWNGDGSLNHPTFGCVGFWFYEGLAGIRPDPAAPGFKKIIIRPAVVGDLTWARAWYDSVHGRIRSQWQRRGDRLTLRFTIPANTTATVFVPARDAASVSESGRPAASAEGVTFLRTEPGAAVYSVGSGSYSFQSTLPPGPAVGHHIR